MSSRRVQKAAQAIREVVSMAILTDLNDPRVQHVTVTFVEVTPNMREATVHVSIMGDDTRQRLSLAGLRSAAGYLQSEGADRIDTRYTPKLKFELDMGVKKSIEMAAILRRVLPQDSEAAPHEAIADHEVPDDDIDTDDIDTDLADTDLANDDMESDDNSSKK